MFTSLFMDPLGPDPLIRSFERHLYAENRSSRTVMEWLRFRKSLGQGQGRRSATPRRACRSRGDDRG